MIEKKCAVCGASLPNNLTKLCSKKCEQIYRRKSDNPLSDWMKPIIYKWWAEGESAKDIAAIMSRSLPEIKDTINDPEVKRRGQALISGSKAESAIYADTELCRSHYSNGYRNLVDYRSASRF